MDCKIINIDDTVNILNSFVTLVSGGPEIDKQPGIRIKPGSSGAPENTDLVCRFLESQFHGQYMMKMSSDYSCTDSHTEKYMVARNFTWSTIKLAHLLFFTYWFIQMRLRFSLPDVCLLLPSPHILHYNHVTRNRIELLPILLDSSIAPYSSLHLPILHQSVRLCWLNV